MIYELFTGEKLFPGDEAEDIIEATSTRCRCPKMSSMRRGPAARASTTSSRQALVAQAERSAAAARRRVLRALIELTYESSIVATALDVAEAVGYVVDLSTPTGKRLDDIIRAQLANVAESSVARQTARGERRTGAATGEPTDMPKQISAASDRLTAEGSAPHDLEHLTAITVARRKRRTGSEESLDDSGAVAAAVRDTSGEMPILPPIEGVPVLMARVDSDGISRLELDETTVTVAPWELGNGTAPAMPVKGPKNHGGERIDPAAAGVRASGQRARGPVGVADPCAAAVGPPPVGAVRAGRGGRARRRRRALPRHPRQRRPGRPGWRPRSPSSTPPWSARWRRRRS